MLTASLPRSRRPPKRPADLRAAILETARRLYLAEGPDAVSARKIARAVGVSATAIYLHFRSIDALLDELRLEGHALLQDHLRRGAGDPALPAAERVCGMGRAYFRFGVEHRGYYELMFHFRPGRPPRPEAVAREIETLLLLRDVVAAGVAKGEVRAGLDPLVAANALWAQIHGVTNLAVSGLLAETAAGCEAAVLDGVLESGARWLGA